MSWAGNEEAAATTRIATVLNSLHPTERRVSDFILADLAAVVEMTAQDLADRTGVARSSVIRTCQRLGYRGFPQLRVALTRELAQSVGAPHEFGESALGRIRADIASLAAALPQIASVLSEADVESTVTTLLGANRLLSLANGLSSPLASDLSLRLTAIGRPTEYVADPIGQQIAGRQLGGGDAAIILSGSGANESSLKVARAVKQTQATLIVITSFATSPLQSLADISLVVAPAGGSFRHELEHTSRVAHVILLESLVEVVASRLGDHARSTRSAVLAILSDNLSD